MKEQRNQILVSRVVDGDATTAEWDELKTLADDDPAVWRQLADTLRDHSAFARAVNESVSVAEAVETPMLPHTGGDRRRAHASSPLARIGGWTGWVVAAVVTFAGLTAFFQQQTATKTQALSGTPTGMMNGASAADLLQAYLDRGRQEHLVLGEVPDKVLLETRPATDGKGFEVLYLRQILERTVVPDLYQGGARDELGRPTLVRYEPRQGPSM